MRISSARAVAAALLTALALTGCGDDGDDGRTATDRSGDHQTETTPSASPTLGSYPSFAPTDYRFTLRVTCFCPDAGVPVRVTVLDGEVSSAVYDQRSAGFDRGEAAPDYRALTINQVIDELNAAVDAESVRVEWPEGQDYPSMVSIDRSARIADEEIGYRISDVEVG